MNQITSPSKSKQKKKDCCLQDHQCDHTVKMKKMFCTYCQIGECSQCSGLEFSAWCNHDCNYLKKEKLGYKEKELFV